MFKWFMAKFAEFVINDLSRRGSILRKLLNDSIKDIVIDQVKWYTQDRDNAMFAMQRGIETDNDAILKCLRDNRSACINLGHRLKEIRETERVNATEETKHTLKDVQLMFENTIKDIEGRNK